LIIKQHFSLKNYNTFGIDVKAKNFVEIQNKEDLCQLFLNTKNTNEIFILGGGSNVLFSKDFDGLIIKMNNKNVQKVYEDNTIVHIKADAGVEWDELVEICTKNEWFGLENLSLIPGTVGASPVQNIGAFGVEAGDFILSVDVFDKNKAIFETVTNKQCCFDYRDSNFKHEWKNKYIVTSVTFELQKKPIVNLSYEALNNVFSKNQSPLPAEVRKAVIQIRESKLPNVKTLGNAGSFFKNPVISSLLFQKIQKEYPEIVFYQAPNNMTKLAAGWLIEKAGWKGYKHKNAGVHNKQALVMVNLGNANPNEILELATMIETSVLEKFEVVLEKEVIII
jgi:UDP-N-acetylmuramate dehydrogenase